MSVNCYYLILELGKIQKKFLLKIKTSTIKSEENIDQAIHSTSLIFNLFWNFYYLFCIFPDFKKKIWFCEKNYNFVLSPLHTTQCNIWVNWYFSTHLWYARVCGKIQIHPNIALGGVQGRQNKNIPWIKWYHTVSDYANGAG